MNNESLNKLTAIVPIGKLSDNLKAIKLWVPVAIKHEIKIIFVNDQIDPETSKNIEEYVDLLSSPNIKLIVGTFNGPGGARNRGLKEVCTEWVCFWDADDAPLITNIAQEMKEIQQEDMIVGQFEITFKSNEEILTYPKPAKDLFDISMNPGLWRCLLRTMVAKKAEFPQTYMGEDQIYLARLSKYLAKAKISERLFYTYIQGNGTQLTASKSRLLDLRNSIVELNELEKKSDFIDEKKILLTIFIRQCMTLIKRGNKNLKFFGLHHLFFSDFSSSYILRLKLITRILRNGIQNAR